MGGTAQGGRGHAHTFRLCLTGLCLGAVWQGAVQYERCWPRSNWAESSDTVCIASAQEAASRDQLFRRCFVWGASVPHVVPFASLKVAPSGSDPITAPFFSAVPRKHPFLLYADLSTMTVLAIPGPAGGIHAVAVNLGLRYEWLNLAELSVLVTWNHTAVFLYGSLVRILPASLTLANMSVGDFWVGHTTITQGPGTPARRIVRVGGLGRDVTVLRSSGSTTAGSGTLAVAVTMVDQNDTSAGSQPLYAKGVCVSDSWEPAMFSPQCQDVVSDDVARALGCGNITEDPWLGRLSVTLTSCVDRNPACDDCCPDYVETALPSPVEGQYCTSVTKRPDSLGSFSVEIAGVPVANEYVYPDDHVYVASGPTWTYNEGEVEWSRVAPAVPWGVSWNVSVVDGQPGWTVCLDMDTVLLPAVVRWLTHDGSPLLTLTVRETPSYLVYLLISKTRFRWLFQDPQVRVPWVAAPATREDVASARRTPAAGVVPLANDPFAQCSYNATWTRAADRNCSALLAHTPLGDSCRFEYCGTRGALDPGPIMADVAALVALPPSQATSFRNLSRRTGDSDCDFWSSVVQCGTDLGPIQCADGVWGPQCTLACGDAAHWCSGGERYTVDEGYYSVPEDRLKVVRSGQAECEAGHFCVGGIKVCVQEERYGQSCTLCRTCGRLGHSPDGPAYLSFCLPLPLPTVLTPLQVPLPTPRVDTLAALVPRSCSVVALVCPSGASGCVGA
jgi:hypothetical protein